MPLSTDQDGDLLERLHSEEVSPISSPIMSPMRQGKFKSNSNAGLSLEDLDLLPTKERSLLLGQDVGKCLSCHATMLPCCNAIIGLIYAAMVA